MTLTESQVAARLADAAADIHPPDIDLGLVAVRVVARRRRRGMTVASTATFVALVSLAGALHASPTTRVRVHQAAPSPSPTTAPTATSFGLCPAGAGPTGRVVVAPKWKVSDNGLALRSVTPAHPLKYVVVYDDVSPQARLVDESVILMKPRFQVRDVLGSVAGQESVTNPANQIAAFHSRHLGNGTSELTFVVTSLPRGTYALVYLEHYIRADCSGRFPSLAPDGPDVSTGIGADRLTVG